MPHVIILTLGCTLGLAAGLLALACDEQPGPSTDRDLPTSTTSRTTNAALEAKAAQADAQGAVGAATVAGAGAPDEGLDIEEPDARQPAPAPDDPLPREGMNETETPRGDANSEIEAERARKDGADPISREPPRPR